MQILCAIGIRGGDELVRRAAQRVDKDAEWLLLHVIDTGPRRVLDRLGPAHRPPPPPHGAPPPPRSESRGPRPHGSHEDELNRAEESAGEAALKEAQEVARALGLRVATRLERGDPNRVIVQFAQQQEVDLIAIRAREREGAPMEGPASVGHAARFVLDHAPCDVLLVRGTVPSATSTQKALT